MSGSQGYYNSRGRGHGSFSTRGHGFHQQLSASSYSSTSSDDRPSCQICERFGHSILRCWHMFNNIYQDEELPMALVVMHITDVTEQSGAEL